MSHHPPSASTSTSTSASNNTNFPLRECTPSDIPQMYAVYEAAFSAQPTNDVIFPPLLVDAKEKRDWFLKRYERYFRKGDVRFYKIVDVDVDVVGEREGDGDGGKVVAWMKWGFPILKGSGHGNENEEEIVEVKDIGKEEEEDDATNEGGNGSGWPRGTDLKFVEMHYGMLDRWQEKYVVPSDTYVAHFLCTSPEYQRKGFATRLLRVGLDRADEEARKTYIEASPDGYPLYLKLGFEEVERDTFSLQEWGGKRGDFGGHVCMIRDPRVKTVS